MGRTRYIVSYDIADPKRLRKVAKVCQAYGARLQYSVFECPLDDLRLVELKAALQAILQHDDDQVLFISLGPVESSHPLRIEAMGQPYVIRSRVTII